MLTPPRPRLTVTDEPLRFSQLIRPRALSDRTLRGIGAATAATPFYIGRVKAVAIVEDRKGPKDKPEGSKPTLRVWFDDKTHTLISQNGLRVMQAAIGDEIAKLVGRRLSIALASQNGASRAYAVLPDECA